MENSHIEWTHHTFNPWEGCVKVSAGCANCYAEKQNKRFLNNNWGVGTDRKMRSDAYWKEPLRWNEEVRKSGVRKRVFCASLADVFEDHPQVEMPRHRLYKLIQDTPYLDWLLLTKRPENILALNPFKTLGIPFNVWLGTSVEDQKSAHERIPYLLDVPASVRFLSMEPLLSYVDLGMILLPGSNNFFDCLTGVSISGSKYYTTSEQRAKIDWVIVGGESGPKARPMNPLWAMSLRNQCKRAGTSFFFKQWGEWMPLPESIIPGAGYDMKRMGKKESGRLLQGQLWDEIPTYNGK